MQYELDKATGMWRIADFSKSKADCEAFIKAHSTEIVIMSESDRRYVKDCRTDIRKKSEEIKRLRLELNQAAMGTFNEQAKELESMLDDADKALKAKLDEYDKAEGLSKPKTMTLYVKSFNEAHIQAVYDYAKQLGCYAEIK